MSPEKDTIKSQRARISRYVHNHVVETDLSPSNPRSFYSWQPVDDPEYETLYELAGGKPTLYAILVNENETEFELDAALQDIQKDKKTGAQDPERVERVNAAKEKLAMLNLLEDQYRDPLNYPFPK